MEEASVFCIKINSANVKISSEQDLKNLFRVYKLNSQEEFNYFLEICKESKEGENVFTVNADEQVSNPRTLWWKIEQLGWVTNYEEIFS